MPKRGRAGTGDPPVALRVRTQRSRQLRGNQIDGMCTVVHTPSLEIKRTAAFHSWLAALKDDRARVRINARLTRFAAGNPGDYKSVGDGVCELRIDYGPGYRVYYAKPGHVVVWLLCGGDKRTQAADIKRAKQLKALLEC